MDEQLIIGFDRNYTPSELNREVRLRLESNYAVIWVEGEISSLSQPASGHSYFALKDEKSQLRCALFRQHRLKVGCQLEAGMQVRVRGRLSLYEARGDYQLIADRVELAGEGQLLQQFEQLKRRLADEGLFAESNKRSLPKHLETLAIVTSPTGAAVQDVLKVLGQRYPLLRVIVVPSLVQGDQAPAALIKALERAQSLAVDAILLTRGGGSMEDLWAFNDEALARVIAASERPIVSAIGHEIDTTIADFVADASAPTPSAAAVMLTPDRAELMQRVQRHRQGLLTSLRASFQARAQQLDHAERRLRRESPTAQLQRMERRLGRARQRLPQISSGQLALLRHELANRNERLLRFDPVQQLKLAEQQFHGLRQRLNRLTETLRSAPTERLAKSVGKLDALSPLGVLARGYSITSSDDGDVLRSVADSAPGQQLRTRLLDGEIISKVIEP